MVPTLAHAQAAPVMRRMSDANQAHCARVGLGLHFHGTTAYSIEEETIMAWTTPTLVEICIGLEINGYLPAEF